MKQQDDGLGEQRELSEWDYRTMARRIFLLTDNLTVSIVTSKALLQKLGRCIQVGVTLHLMAKIRMQEGKYAETLAHVQEAVTIFRGTGSWHLPEAEAMLKELLGLGISKDSC